MQTEFKIPELGENIKQGDVVKILVKVGDVIAIDQPVLELETDKAVVEVPSRIAGTVTEVKVKVGGKAKVGDIAFLVESSGAAAVPVSKKVEAAKPASATKPEQQEVKLASQKTAPVVSEKSEKEEELESESENNDEAEPVLSRSREAFAAPSVRKLAREIGVDLSEVKGSGPQGRVTLDDVKSFARRVSTDVGGFSGSASSAASSLPDFSKWGEFERKAMTSVRRKTAERLSYAWQTIPHVTQHDEADITELEKLRQQFGSRAKASGGNLTVTVILLKIVASALKVFPQFNASIDMSSQEIIYKKYCNVGVAVDTDRGLLVPVIRDADKKNIVRLSVELNESAERARTKKTTIEEMQGGCFTITNLGGIGGGFFTPIINPPEVAILGVGRWQYRATWLNEQWQPRKVLPLSLSYDHRLIDGADAARFLRWIVEAVNQPFLMDLEG